MVTWRCWQKSEPDKGAIAVTKVTWRPQLDAAAVVLTMIKCFMTTLFNRQSTGESFTPPKSKPTSKRFDFCKRDGHTNTVLKQIEPIVHLPDDRLSAKSSLAKSRLNAATKVTTSILWRLSWLLTVYVCLICSKAHTDIIFSAKTIGPATSIYAIDQKNVLVKLTEHDNWRDTEPVVNNRNELLFLSNRKANKKIDIHQRSDAFNVFLKDLKLQKITQITDDSHKKQQPLFSPDGKWISYIQRQADKDSIRLMHRETRKTFTLLSTNKILDYTWSPNNRSIVFAGSKPNISHITEYEIVNKKSTPLLRLTDDNLSVNKLAPPHQPGTNSSANQQPSQTIVSISYSPNGKKLAYITADRRDQQRKLNVFDIENTTIHRVSDTGVQVQSPIDWSRDSQKILYAGLENYEYFWDEKNYRKVYRGEMNIFLSSLNGETRKLSKGPALYNRPVFSPDEKQIAFLYGDSLAERDLYLKTMDIAGKNVVQRFSPVPGFSTIDWR